ncbi:hypothetical protein BDU57DRAFT_573752 [Ampelomyces quisqualis]|uniref:Uncharacterized protein n=1 Tax=Ampelomyces quisqualis TaxID=50730 RepID=A0A6A5QL89_AMPQU|nr:hypothetical protein BDU57DRAFT_573752 [Ampelomyces quisqualis]
MFSVHTTLHSMFAAMLFTGIILAPVAIATPAVKDLADLRIVINAAAGTIGDTNNPNRGWGFNIGKGESMGTADLVNNITNTVLRMKFQIDTNLTAWLLPDNATIPAANGNTPTPLPPTLPLTSSIAMPSAVPTSIVNATVDLSTPYIDYISTIPSLSTSLTSLGRAYHREMNSPVNQAIQGLQQSLTTLQTTMLQSNLIGSPGVLRTIRASSSLENAQVAWGRFLNLPGRASASDSGETDSETEPNNSLSRRQVGSEGHSARLPPEDGKYYTHKELWGRYGPRWGMSRKMEAKWADVLVQWEVRRARVAHDGAGNARIGQPSVV